MDTLKLEIIEENGKRILKVPLQIIFENGNDQELGKIIRNQAFQHEDRNSQDRGNDQKLAN